MKEKLEPVTKEWFEQMKTRLEASGYVVTNKWRKGTTSLHLKEIVLDESPIQGKSLNLEGENK